MFQFTHPGGVRLRQESIYIIRACFNSRTREGCDVSLDEENIQEPLVSIHAPGRGATRSAPYKSCYHYGFNSRTREGCDTIVQRLHTSVMFQFTHPGGVRPLLGVVLNYFGQFQFTHPGGVRPHGGVISSPQRCLNSRTREGCDAIDWENVFGDLTFQFTHPGGVRPPFRPVTESARYVSIHAPGRGATCPECVL